MRNNPVNFFEFWPVVREEMSLEDISYLELWWPFYTAQLNHLCNFGRGYYEVQFCEIILNLDQWFRRWPLEDISYLELWPPFCSANRTICAIFLEGLWGTNLWNYFEFDQWFKEMAFKNISYLELLWPFCSAEQNHLCNFGRGHQEEQFCEIILNLDQWFKRRCRLKCFLTGALAALLFSTAEPFKQFWYRALWGTILWNNFEPVVQEMSFKEISYLELWLPFCSPDRNHLCNLGRGHYEERFCEFILNLGQWFRRCRLKDFLSGALAALLFSGVETIVQFWNRASWGTFMWSYMKLDQWFRRKCRFKKKFTDDRLRTKTDHNNSHRAFGSGERKSQQTKKKIMKQIPSMQQVYNNLR